MKNGIIIIFVELLIKLFNKLNLVDHFKNIALFLTKDKEKINIYKSMLIDIFIILKYIFIITLIYFGKQSYIITIFVCYLIVSNLYTYFYRHLWIPPFKNEQENIKRRYVNLVLSFIFSNLSFYYLYLFPFSHHFTVLKGHSKEIAFFLYSNYNSIFGSYQAVVAKDDLGSLLTLVQLSISFIFISIILSNSIPQFKTK